MFTELDHILFPDKCEVLRIDNNYFYPIFKNGSSSLRQRAKIENSHTLINQQIFRCDSIVIFLRDPRKRLVSGAHSFISHVRTDNPELDERTIVWFIQNYLFLDRHILPQFLWLINLIRYCNPDCEFEFRDVVDMDALINVHSNKSEEINPLAHQIIESKHLDSYLRLEDHLMEFVGKTAKWQEIYSTLYSKEKDLCNHIFNKARIISDALS